VILLYSWEESTFEINLLDFNSLKILLYYLFIEILNSAFSFGFVFSRNWQCSYVFVFGRAKMSVSGLVLFRPKLKNTVSVGL